MAFTDSAKLDALFKKYQGLASTGKGRDLAAEQNQSTAAVYADRMFVDPVPTPVAPSGNFITDICATDAKLVLEGSPDWIIAYQKTISALLTVTSEGVSYTAFQDASINNIIPTYPIRVTRGPTLFTRNQYTLDYESGILITTLGSAPITLTCYCYAGATYDTISKMESRINLCRRFNYFWWTRSTIKNSVNNLSYWTPTKEEVKKYTYTDLFREVFNDDRFGDERYFKTTYGNQMFILRFFFSPSPICSNLKILCEWIGVDALPPHKSRVWFNFMYSKKSHTPLIGSLRGLPTFTSGSVDVSGTVDPSGYMNESLIVNPSPATQHLQFLYKGNGVINGTAELKTDFTSANYGGVYDVVIYVFVDATYNHTGASARIQNEPTIDACGGVVSPVVFGDKDFLIKDHIFTDCFALSETSSKTLGVAGVDSPERGGTFPIIL
jgi:hypothetical protein